MERNFYHENFESSLKEDADQFKMYPSKKVWHGIYNNVHPGRRWPSTAISVLFIFTLVIVGHLNTGNSRNAYSNLKIQPDEALVSAKVTKRLTSGARSKRVSQLSKNEQIPAVLFPYSTGESSSTSSIAGNSIPPQINEITEPGNGTGTAIEMTNQGQKVSLPNEDLHNANASSGQSAIAEHLPEKILNQPNSISTSELNLPVGKKSLQKITVNKIDSKKSEPDQILQAETALRNRIMRNKISWTIYMNPSLSYRTYSNLEKSVALNQIMSPNANNKETADERPALGMQGGASVNYNLTKKLKFIAGMRLGYLEFNKKASYVHPTIASLMLINSVTGTPYTMTTFSNFGNFSGAASLTLHNYSFQASTPFGLQYTIGSDDDMKLDVTGTFQPIYVISSHGYLLSSNNKNFISEPSLSRKWNMGISIGTLLSFGSSSYKWQVGPNVDYQLLSTYDSRYPVKEHLINYGVKLGVTKIRK
ncbi:MAG: hypothetical protein ABJA57_06930 [Ginsengibacter sp.]